jgi:putative ABC transport system permease protein
MKIAYVFKSAFTALRANKARTGLTVLGIVIGIAAIMLVFVIGKSAQDLILGQVEGLGARTIAIAPGREPQGPTDPSVVEIFYSDSLKEKELEALKNRSNVPGLEEIMPVVFGIETVSFRGETFRSMVLGGTGLITEIFNISPESGKFISEDDILSRAQSVVIGIRLKSELFGESDAIGEKIKIKNQNFEVIGVLPKKGQVLFFNFDEIAIVPYTSAQSYIFGIKHFNRLIARAQNDKEIPKTVRDIEVTLRELHNITDPDDDDFFVAAQAELAETFKTVTDILTLFLASVATISLVVGGIGIMNVMLVAVTERTREIGLRKALGATSGNIMLQFLIEAVAITSAGGAMGIIFGVAFSFGAVLALAHFLEASLKFSFPFAAVGLGLLVSALVGLIFGLYPAWRASKKSPIEALRYE